ncbi:MAG: family 10 glycosylhydrolase [Bacteroidales bacterium]|nr:family 10 glycosylhydrolase [Bacteroidales bacterium]
MFKKIVCSLLALALVFACDKPPVKPQEPVDVDPTDTLPPTDTTVVDPVDSNYIAPGDTIREKPLVMWIDASANFQRFAQKKDIKAILKRARSYGFNGIVVGVKPGNGRALYESEFLQPCTVLGGAKVERDYDYLEYILTTAKELGMRVEASASVMVMGANATKAGALFDDEYFMDLECIEYLPDGLHKISETGQFGAINPCHPKTVAYVKRMLTEMFSNPKYAALDGFVLDYCRYMDANSDFSDYSRSCFEGYIGKPVENWPEDIYYYKSPDVSRGDYTPGPLYNQWIEWRARVIQNVVTEARSALKVVRPDADLSVWAAAWYPLPHTGQNWGSPRYTMVDSQWWATRQYHTTGYADQLDYFQLGAYYSKVLGYTGSETVQYALGYCRQILKGDCPFWGTFSVAEQKFDVENAVKLCLTDTDGCMVFDLCHIASWQHWKKIKAGADAAWEELGVNSPLKSKQFPSEE